MKNKGFTLIELLAVIIILGILMLIAIPSVTNYINNSRKETYVDTVSEMIKGASILVNSGEYEVTDPNTTYYIPLSGIKTENGEARSPYGKFGDAYVVVTYDGDNYDYYFVGKDEADMGMDELTSKDSINKDSIKANVDEIYTDVGIDGREKIIVFDGDGNVASNDNARMTVSGNGRTGGGGSGHNSPSGLLCRRARRLSKETCPEGNKWGCKGTGYAYGATVTYGSYGTVGELTPGDAFDCDVNGDGHYDAELERFYFISDYYDTYEGTFDSSVAVLLYDRNTGSATNHTANTWPQGALDALPTEEEWPNVELYKSVRKINTSFNYGHISRFDYSGHVARLISYFEINNACTTMPWNSYYALDRCQYFLTNSGYAGPGGCYNYENVVSHPYLGAIIPNSSYGCTRCISDSNCAIRPAIEVPKNRISY